MEITRKKLQSFHAEKNTDEVAAMEKKKILIIDDDLNIRITLSDILILEGYEPFTVENGAAGLEFLKQTSVNVVLIDLGLPDMPGLDVLSTVKAEHPSTEAIILTGNTSLNSAIEATNREAFSYLLKPYGIDQILLHIRRAMEKQQSEEALRISRQILEDVTQGITESIFLISKDYKIRWANKTALNNIGLKMDEIASNCCYDVIHHLKSPCENSPEPCPLSELLATGISRTVQQVHVDKEGNKLITEANVYPVKNDSGEVREIVYVLKDITERVRMVEEIADKVKQLEASLSRVKQLEGIIPICMYCKKIRDDKEEWSRVEEYITEHSEANFSHGLCPECEKKMHAELDDEENIDQPK